MSLADDWQRKLEDAAKDSNNPRDYVRTDKGTKVTQATVDAIRADESGLVVIADNTQKVLESMDRAIARALEAIGIQAEGDAKALCPVDTGRLKNSITHAIDAGGKAVYIGTNVEYAPYIELGTSRNRAGQPFLVPTVVNNFNTYQDIARSMMENA